MYPTEQYYMSPLYPMDPCRPNPQPMMPSMPMMPMCPMMDPRFRECVQICMMQCGNSPMPYQNPYYPENV